MSTCCCADANDVVLTFLVRAWYDNLSMQRNGNEIEASADAPSIGVRHMGGLFALFRKNSGPAPSPNAPAMEALCKTYVISENAPSARAMVGDMDVA